MHPIIAILIIAVLFYGDKLLGRYRDKLAEKNQRLKDEIRTIELVRTARLLYPGAADVNALDFYYQKLYKEIVIAKRNGQQAADLVRDHILVFHERLYLIEEESKNEIACSRLRAVARV